ncbi:phosphatidylserine decarboxylase [Streptomyces caatingaensis]|uniref:Phosphatidylserine decarboxylase n=1 Tax=Streptomyces caatingaensis TaxID=1678637 RepID=A0A0K9XCC9_9ACTN|nr:phosphatidylserine decarboxylase [Streptomyces caatingaensis]KNB50858.1 phosphatidylserine decarboxylase [Streptomyces caatingaensis]
MTQGREWPPSADINHFLETVEDWYHADREGFQTLYEAAVANVVPYPAPEGGQRDNEWKNKDIKGLCEFFRSWHRWQLEECGVDNGLEYIEKFSELNYENDYGMVFVTCGPGLKMLADFTQLQGRQMDSEESRKVTQRWIEQLGKKRMDDYVALDWRNFNEFFVREVKKDRRPVDAPADDSVVVAPADCVINMIVDRLTLETPIPVKSVTMNVQQLLDGSPYAEKFLDGTAVSCVLMPDNYHRYHAPVSGEVVESRADVGGVYYGMRDFPDLLNKGDVGYGYDYEMFDQFRRGYVVIRTRYLDAEGKPVPGPDGVGHVGMVTVGLNSIASVVYQEQFRAISPESQPVPVRKGEEIGYFQYGGSLNILLFEKDRFPALQVLQGQRIGLLERKERVQKLFTSHHHLQSRRLRRLAP